MAYSRKDFLKTLGAGSLAFSAASALPIALSGCSSSTKQKKTQQQPYSISLAQWSLHRTFHNGEKDPMKFAQIARQEFGIDAVEYVNTFYFDYADNDNYLKELKKTADGEGVENVLIMCDAEGALGDPDEKARIQAVENHHKWVKAAQFLGCHSIRVNARSQGAYEEQQKLAADGLRRLCEYAVDYEINVIVENHGGLSSNGEWLVGVMKMVDHPLVGTLPDFGNFDISDTKSYDRYKGVKQLMPYAKGVSAKTYDFDDQGNETTIDYPRMMDIVTNAGYSGRVGIEYEGSQLSEPEGIIATKDLLEKISKKMTESAAKEQ